MGRLPFDPGKMRTRKDPSASQASRREMPEAMSVSAFARLIERTVADAFPRKVTVRGEVSGARHRTHFYFNLKDENAVIGAVMFASAAKRSAVQPTDGRTVLATGKLEYYAPSGRLSLIVESLAEDGVGSLEARFRALCDDYRARGWFDPDAKQPVPTFPRRIAVLTAAKSAALHDVLDTAKQRCPAVELVLVDIPVQGERAAPTIARTLRAVDRNAGTLGIDAILLTRGGGSVEDLWSFNEPAVAEAIHACRVPIVAAIGHESDTTIAELVADHRSATPTQATVRLTPDRAALARQLGSLDSRRSRALRHFLELEQRRVASLARRPVLADPRAILTIQRTRTVDLARRLSRAAAAILSRRTQTIAGLGGRLNRHHPSEAFARRQETLFHLTRELKAAAHARLAAHRGTLRGLTGVLHAVDPTAVLERGYSITTRADGSVVRRPADVAPGDRVRTRLAGGEIDSIIEGDPPRNAPSQQAGSPSAPPAAPPGSKPSPRQRRTRPQSRQADPGLFGPEPD